MSLALWWPDEGRPKSQPPARGHGGAATVQAVVTAYLDHLRFRHDATTYSAESLRNAERGLRSFAAWHGKTPICRCVPNDLERWFGANHERWQSPYTKGRELASILACFNWAASEAGLIDKSPYRKLKTLSWACEPGRDATVEEYEALTAGDGPLRDALFFIAQTGARPAEMRTLEFPNVAWKERVAVLEQHKTRHVTGKPRYILLNARVIELLETIRCRQQPGARQIFLNSRGTPWSKHTLPRAVRRQAQKIGLDKPGIDPVSPYSFRHFFATRMAADGFSDREIATMLGHKNTNLVSHYCHLHSNLSALSTLARRMDSGGDRLFLPGMEP